MGTIRIQDIQRDPDAFLKRIAAGEPLLLVRDDHALAEIRPMKSVEMPSRPFGKCAGQFRVPDDFDALLPDEIVRDFEGS